MKSAQYARFLKSQIDELISIADYHYDQIGRQTVDFARSRERQEHENYIQLIDDMCDLLYSVGGRTYHDMVEADMSDQEYAEMLAAEREADLNNTAESRWERDDER